MKKIFQCSLLLVLINSCTEPFSLESIDYEQILVVEGQITDENKNHEVKLSYTYPIDTIQLIPETGALVRVVDGDDLEYIFNENEPGTYRSSQFAGVQGQTYTLFITTSAGLSFRSEQVVQKETAEIESIDAEYTTNDDKVSGVEVYVTTEQSGNDISPFYRWEWEETYEIVVPFPSQFVWIGDNLVEPREVQVGNCWTSNNSSSILIKSAQGLSENKITKFPLKFLPNETEELRIRYSILVRQYALDNSTFLYWRTIDEILSEQGSLSDIQPGNVTGNIISESGAPVLGYFDASNVSTRRFFVKPQDFEEEGYETSSLRNSCEQVLIEDARIGDYLQTRQKTHVIYVEVDAGAFGDNTPAGYTFVKKPCGDCSDTGTINRPSFW